MNREIVVEFSESAFAGFKVLEDSVTDGSATAFDIQLLRSIHREKDNLKVNPQYGTHIPRTSVPLGAARRYGTERLWKVELVGYWRLIYTLAGDEKRLVVLVLEFMDHKKYDKVFGYRKA